MTQPATTQPRNALFLQDVPPSLVAFGVVMFGSTCAIAAGIFTAVSPLGGAVFGVSFFLSNRLVHWICDKVGCCPDHIIFKVGRFALSLIGGISAAVLVTTVVGFPMTAAACLILTAAPAVATVASLLVFGGCLCSSAVVTGVALGGNGQTTSAS
jgi:hypothetical protein